MKELNRFRQFLAEGDNFTFELNGREVVDLEVDGGYGTDPFISAAYYLDTGEELDVEEIEDLVNKYPADLELGGAWWDQRHHE